MPTSRLHLFPHPSSVSSFQQQPHPSTSTLPLAIAPLLPTGSPLYKVADTHHDLSTTEDASTSHQVRKSKYYGDSSEVSQLISQGRQRIREQRQALREK